MQEEDLYLLLVRGARTRCSYCVKHLMYSDCHTHHIQKLAGPLKASSNIIGKVLRSEDALNVGLLTVAVA